MKSIKTLAALLLLSIAAGCSSIDVITDATGASNNVNVAAGNDYRGDLEADSTMRALANDSNGK